MVDFPMMPQWMFPGAGMMAGMPGVPDMDPATLNAMKWQQGFGMLSDIGAGLARAGMAGKGLGAAGLGVASGLDQNRQRRAQEQEGAFKGMLMQGQLGEMAQKQQQRAALAGWFNTPQGKEMLAASGMSAEVFGLLPPDQQAAALMQTMKDKRLAGALPEIPGGGPSPQPQGAGAVGGAPGATDYYSALRGAESGGRNVPNAMGSGAFGPYQFMPATWAGLVQKYGQTHGLTADGLRDPQQQEKAIRLFTADNRDALKTALGRDPTPDEIYAAHRLGAAGAVKLIQAPPMAQGGALFPTYTVQNPDLNQPAGVIRDQWKARFGNLPVDTMSGGQPPQGGGAPMPQPGGQAGPVDFMQDPHYASMVPAYRAAVKLGDSKKALEIYTEMGKRRSELLNRDAWSVDPANPLRQVNKVTGEVRAVPQPSYQVKEVNGRVVVLDPATAGTPTGPGVRDLGPTEQFTPSERAKLREGQATATTLVESLRDFTKEWKASAPGTWAKTVAGAPTPLRTAWTNAALLSKGEQLYNLGVLSGPDLQIIRGALADPSTFAGATATSADVDRQVEMIIKVIATKVNAHERLMGLKPTDFGLKSEAATPATSAPAIDYGKLYGFD